MKTLANHHFRPVPRANRLLTVARQPALERSHSFGLDLAMTPDVRAEAVARGKALIADPNYPSQQQLKSIARLLAAKL